MAAALTGVARWTIPFDFNGVDNDFFFISLKILPPLLWPCPFDDEDEDEDDEYGDTVDGAAAAAATDAANDR
jgi:hypothetical protein